MKKKIPPIRTYSEPKSSDYTIIDFQQNVPHTFISPYTFILSCWHNKISRLFINIKPLLVIFLHEIQ